MVSSVGLFNTVTAEHVLDSKKEKLILPLKFGSEAEVPVVT